MHIYKYKTVINVHVRKNDNVRCDTERERKKVVLREASREGEKLFTLSLNAKSVFWLFALHFSPFAYPSIFASVCEYFLYRQLCMSLFHLSYRLYGEKKYVYVLREYKRTKYVVRYIRGLKSFQVTLNGESDFYKRV